jgi:hypothetical protein
LWGSRRWGWSLPSPFLPPPLQQCSSMGPTRRSWRRATKQRGSQVRGRGLSLLVVLLLHSVNHLRCHETQMQTSFCLKGVGTVMNFHIKLKFWP